MSEAFLGEIRMVGFNYAPRSWAFCNGQTFPIAQNQALFALLGTTYGGNGQTTFLLPNLQDRAPVHVGMGLTLGEIGGQASHTLNLLESEHTHVLRASANQAANGNPAGNVLAAKRRGGKDLYAPGPAVALDELSISSHAGGGVAHENRQPFLYINFVICIAGIFPARN